MRPSTRLVPTSFAALTLVTASLPAQAAKQAGESSSRTPSAFTAEDALAIDSHTISDLTNDGRYLAVIETVRRDSYGQDFRRDGDPSYTRAVPSRLEIVDTKSGAVQQVFPDKRTVKGARWSPDGKRLAMLLYNGDIFEPAVWDASTKKVTVSHIPAGQYVAENSDIRWTPDGKQLVFALHTTAWRKKARDTFTNMTVGPVFVQSSLDPFLAWDDVRRLGNVRSVVTFDPQTSTIKDLIPESMVSNYTLAEDGTAISFNQDVQKKTDYDSFNSETSLRTRAMAGGAERSLYATTKGMQLVWSEDGKHYAYGKDGRVYVGSIDDASAKQLLGPAEVKRGEAPDTSKAARERVALERFSVVRYSPKADAIIASNKEGLWLVDVASGNKDKIVATDDFERDIAAGDRCGMERRRPTHLSDERIA